MMALLDVRGLRTYFETDDGLVKAVDDIDLQIAEGETLGLVGESGSGKSVTSLTLMRLLPPVSSRVAGGGISFLGRDLLTVSNAEMAAMRGKDLAMIFQEPMSSLNPVIRVGDQVAEAIIRHQKISRAEARERTVALFDEVGLPDPGQRIFNYPHEMSGGQKQRVMIAMALSCNPKLLIADEPTTALDVTIQAQILDLLRNLRDTRAMSMLFITHDLGVIAEIADHVAVMFRGRLVEHGPVEEVFARPKHAYTKGLLACRPRLETPYKLLPTVQDYLSVDTSSGRVEVIERVPDPSHLERLVAGVERPALKDEPLLEVTDLHVHFRMKSGWLGKPRVIKAVDGVDFNVRHGETFGLVGESGCGKTTTGRAILRLVEPTRGQVRFRGSDIGSLSHAELVPIRRQMQIVFQDPYSSLNPRMTVQDALVEPMTVHGLSNNAEELVQRAAALLEEVGLPPEYLRRYPHEFSGGQRQRICIARALSLEPSFLICDESVSALDVSIQAQVLNLLKELQATRGLTYIFISHDLAVVKFMSDRMAVMQDGRIVEMGEAQEIYEQPRDEYTQRLIAAIPRDDLAHIRGRQEARRRAALRRAAPTP